MNQITEERQSRLNALLAELNTFPTPEMVVRCIQAIGFDPKIKDDLKQADAAMAGAWAFDRALCYLDHLRSLNEERMQLGDEIRRLMRHPNPTSEEEIESAAQARIIAPHLAGKQEIVINFFCVCIQHIRSLLMVTAAAVDYEIPPDDLRYLDDFRFLRNHFEHWYERLPGKTNEVGLITKTLSDKEYSIRGGLQTDERNRFIVIEPKKTGPVTHVVDVTNDGVARVEKIVEETFEKVEELAIERVRAHFITNPEHIPSSADLRQDFLITVGRYEPLPNP